MIFGAGTHILWALSKFSAHASVCVWVCGWGGGCVCSSCVCAALKLRMYCNSTKAYLLSSLLRLARRCGHMSSPARRQPIQVWPYARQVRRLSAVHPWLHLTRLLWPCRFKLVSTLYLISNSIKTQNHTDTLAHTHTHTCTLASLAETALASRHAHWGAP